MTFNLADAAVIAAEKSDAKYGKDEDKEDAEESEEAEGAPGHDADDEEDSEGDESSDAEPEAEKKEAKAPKLHTFIDPEGKEVTVPLTAKFKHKVDGKDVEFELGKALNEISGNASVQSRMGAVDGEKRKLEAERNTFQASQATVVESAKALNDALASGDPDAIAEACANLTGQDAEEVLASFYENVAPRVQEWFNLEETERERVQVDRQKKGLSREKEKVIQQKDAGKAASELASHVNTLQKDYNLSSEELKAGDEELTELYKAGKLEGTHLEIVKKVAEKKASPEDRKAYVTLAAQAGSNRKTFGIIEKAILKHSPKLKEKDAEKMGKVAQKAYYAIFNPDPDERLDSEAKLDAFVAKQLGKKLSGKAKVVEDDDEDDDDVEIDETDDESDSEPTAKAKSASHTKKELVPDGAWMPKFN